MRPVAYVAPGFSKFCPNLAIQETVEDSNEETLQENQKEEM